MGMPGRLRPQPDGALACRQRWLAHGVNRRRGHHGKSFTGSHRPGRRHLCQRPRYLPRPARLLCAADSAARSPAAHTQLAEVEAVHAPPGRMPVPPKTAQPADARAPAHRDRPGPKYCSGFCGHVCGIWLTSTMRAGIAHLGRRTCAADAGGRWPSAVPVSWPHCPVPGAGRRSARPRPAPGQDRTGH